MRALAHKDAGTAHFRAARWSEALDAYRAALACLPLRAVPPTPAAPTRDDDLDWSGAGVAGGKGEDKVKGKGKEQEEKEEEVLDISSPAVSVADKETTRLRAVLHANVGACLLKMVSGPISPCALVKIDLGARVIKRKLRRRVLKVCPIVRLMGQ